MATASFSLLDCSLAFGFVAGGAESWEPNSIPGPTWCSLSSRTALYEVEPRNPGSKLVSARGVGLWLRIVVGAFEGGRPS